MLGSNGVLINLDLTDASIVKGGRYYNSEGGMFGSTKLYTSNDCIGGRMFCNSDLRSIQLPNNATVIGYKSFAYCSYLTSVNIGESVTQIGLEAFYDCSLLTSVIIGESVTTIDEGAFRKCSSLTNVNIPNSVTTIDKYAFQGCSSLTSVSIGESVTRIDSRAFRYCRKLEKVYCYVSTPPSINTSSLNGTFLNTNAFITLYVPKGTKTQYQSSDWGEVFNNIVEMEE